MFSRTITLGDSGLCVCLYEDWSGLGRIALFLSCIDACAHASSHRSIWDWFCLSFSFLHSAFLVDVLGLSLLQALLPLSFSSTSLVCLPLPYFSSLLLLVFVLSTRYLTRLIYLDPDLVFSMGLTLLGIMTVCHTNRINYSYHYL